MPSTVMRSHYEDCDISVTAWTAGRGRMTRYFVSIMSQVNPFVFTFNFVDSSDDEAMRKARSMVRSLNRLFS